MLIALCGWANGEEPKQCAGGYNEGDQVDRGRYWYVCQAGQLVPKGCFTDNKQRIALSESFETGGFVLTCSVDSSGYLSFTYKGCVYEGRQYAPGETWEDSKYWYTCVKDADSLRVDISGCNYENKRYNINDQIERGEFFYECRRYANNTCSMCPVGCLHESRRFRIGESFEQEKYWYICTQEEGKVMKKCVGCMHGNQRLQDGDRYTANDAVFECNIRKDAEPNHKIVGCTDNDDGRVIERKVGCQWTRGTSPYQYVMLCKQKDDNTVVKEAIHCYYAVRDGGYEIDPGCFKIHEDKVLACMNSPTGPLLETFPATQLDQAYYKGVRFC